MADPVTLTAISIGASAAGGGISALGAAQGAASKAAMYNYQAGVAQVNAKIAQQNADYSLMTGEAQAQEQGMAARFQRGEAIATKGASGLDVNTGSNARVVESIQEIGEHNQAVVRADAAKRAYGYEVEAMNATAQGAIYSASAKDVQAAAPLQIASSLLGAAGSVSDKWLTAQQKGIFS